MKTLLPLFLFVLVSCSSPDERYHIVFEDITVVDTKNSELVNHQTVYIKNDRIVKLTPYNQDEEPIADIRINGAGKFMISGFWDMHVHSCWKEELDRTVFPIFFRYGITGIRDMGGSLEILNTFKQRAIHHPSSYPNLYGAGPILDGEHPIHPSVSLSVSAENFRSVLDSLRNSQVDFFKTYSLLSRSVMDSIATYSRAHQIPFSGHISEYITPEQASELGYKSFEHLNKLEDLAKDSSRLKVLFGLLKKHENWLCPTLIMYKRKSELTTGQYFNHSLFEVLDNDLKAEWESVKERATAKTQEEVDQSKARYNMHRELVKAFYDNQIPLLLGTDFAGMPFVYPGYSFHEEMQLMQEIGVPEFEILKMATLNPALYLGISDAYGSIEKHKVADLVILNANPIADIKNTLSIDMVLKSGKIVRK